MLSEQEQLKIIVMSTRDLFTEWDELQYDIAVCLRYREQGYENIDYSAETVEERLAYDREKSDAIRAELDRREHLKDRSVETESGRRLHDQNNTYR